MANAEVIAPDQERRFLAHYGDPDWRIDNLYKIKAEDGQEILCQRNAAQLAYSRRMWSRDAVVKARRLGFSTFIDLKILDTCMFRMNMTAAIIDTKLDDAKKKLAMVMFAYERLPADLRKANPLKTNHSELIEFKNGSSIAVGTSYRGAGLQMEHVSEYGKTSVDRPEQAREIKNGSMRAVPVTGWLAVESTAHGTAGEFYDLVQIAKNMQMADAPLTALDYRLHFYGWWIKPEHRLPNNLVVISLELVEYFKKIAPVLWARHRVRLDADQMAWYAIQYRDLGPDDVMEEFPSLLEETFFNSIQGAFWKRELAKARADKRIGFPVPHDPSKPVNTAWDIGEDCTAIIFHQSDGVRHRLIHYWEEEGSSLQRAASEAIKIKERRGFVWGKHWGPHDLDHKDWANHSMTRKEVAAGLGIKFDVVPQVRDKADSIEAARTMLATTYIDSEHAALLVTRFENYRKRWNKALGVFISDPVHDMASHGSDAGQQLAMGFQPDKVDRGEGRRGRDRRGSQWAG